ncbi:zf-HC2 domain-containing protein [Paenibacillus sp.]|uniref:anti-sigma factor n=1 Tax=Paenibacillus sp. TaxID=58172 RepID=UPI002D6F344D|nr:zf-HC2 domain-containing protein [Paenibacillus sp.]HZG55111.1 zf-HC2 domain-containing protein [Paenibacillus sp.]
MKCDDIRELLPDYWDQPEGDWSRVRVDEHVKRCPACAEEFEMWRESASLIQSAAWEEATELPERGAVSASVMDRIYADEGWRKPVAERLYRIPHRLRIRLLSLVAGCLAMFGCAFLFRLLSPGATATVLPSSGVMTVNALGGGEASEFSIAGIEGVPVASIGDPVVLGLSVVDSYPDYLFVLSMLGLICALLTMNWLARIRA